MILINIKKIWSIDQFKNNMLNLLLEIKRWYCVLSPTIESAHSLSDEKIFNIHINNIKN